MDEAKGARDGHAGGSVGSHCRAAAWGFVLRAAAASRTKRDQVFVEKTRTRGRTGSSRVRTAQSPDARNSDGDGKARLYSRPHLPPDGSAWMHGCL